jgi:hypothetical protein
MNTGCAGCFGLAMLPIALLCFVFPPLGFTLLAIIILAGLLNLSEEVWCVIKSYAISNPLLAAIIIISVAIAFFSYLLIHNK